MTRRHLLAAVLLLAGCSVAVDPGKLPEPPVPGTPTGLSATAGNGQASLSWDSSAGDVVRYQVHQGTDPSTLAKVAEVPASAPAWVATGLTNGVTYHFAVAAVDSAGTVSALSETTSAAPFLPDTVAPNVFLASPGNAATGVPLDATLVVSFSETMDPGSVTVSTSPSLFLGLPSWNAESSVVSFEPAVFGSLVAETSYAVQVAGSDPAGNSTVAVFHFTTVAVPPTLDASTPSLDATGVPTGAAIQLVFSERMDQASVQAAFSASPGVTCTSWSASADGTTLTCLHAAPFSPGTHYVVTIGTGAMDSPAGAHLTAAASFGFWTASAPDTTPPTVAASTPAASGTGAPQATTISVTFSEPVDKVAAQAAFAITSPSGFNPADGGLFTWSADGRTMIYDPPADFAYGQYVQWRITTAVRDLAGNYMTAQVNRAFTVIRQGTATLYSVATLDGYLATSTTYVWTSPAYVGDGTANQYFRGFLSFDLGGIEATATKITSATLYAYQYTMSADPYVSLGSLLAESVDYGVSLDATDLLRAPLQYLGCRRCTTLCICQIGWWDDVYTLNSRLTSGYALSGYKSVVVTSKVEADRAARASRGNRCQFRLRFSSTTDGDGAYDYAGFYTSEAASADNRPKLTVTYEYP